MRVLITGANRGLGLEFAKRYAGRGDQVFATTRNPANATELNAVKGAIVLPLDVTQPKSITELHRQIEAQVDALDLLINNAGVWSSKPGRYVQPFGELTTAEAHAILVTNAVAPVLIAQEFLPLLAKGNNPRLVSISSSLGSISGNSGDAPPHYSASKAALNQYMRSFAGYSAKQSVATVLMSPGWVRTDMGGSNAALSPEESVGGMVQVIDGLTLRDNGTWVDYRGEPQAW